MLGSIIRYLIFVAMVAALTWGLFYIMETPGQVLITFANKEYRLSPLAFVLGLALGFLVLFVLFKLAGFVLALYRFIAGDDTALSRYFDRNRERRGFDALGRAMTALASGDGKTATAKVAKAERLLDRPELTRLVTAQAAEASGDVQQAKRYYKALAEIKQTSFVGVKGLLDLAIAERDDERALKLAKQAELLRPKEESVLDTLYTLQSRSFDWKGARKTLAKQRTAGYLHKPEANRRDAMLALAQAEDAEELGQSEHARMLALEAAKLDPANGEAVSSAVRHLTASGSKRAATRLVTQAWKVAPSPQLAAAFAAIEPEETPEERTKRFKKLFDARSTGTEANLVRAELALSIEDWSEARRYMANLDEDEPSARSCAIMAAIARGEGEPDAVVRGWLARALGAPRGAEHDSVLGQAAMLPLLVGEDVPNGAHGSDEQDDAEDATEPEETAEPEAPEAESKRTASAM